MLELREQIKIVTLKNCEEIELQYVVSFTTGVKVELCSISGQKLLQ